MVIRIISFWVGVASLTLAIVVTIVTKGNINSAVVGSGIVGVMCIVGAFTWLKPKNGKPEVNIKDKYHYQ